MIELFEFQERKIRTSIINNEIWFSCQDVHEALGITWRCRNYLRKKYGIHNEWLSQRGATTVGMLQLKCK